MAGSGQAARSEASFNKKLLGNLPGKITCDEAGAGAVRPCLQPGLCPTCRSGSNMAASGTQDLVAGTQGIQAYYKAKIAEMEILVRDKAQNFRRLEAQRNEVNAKGLLLDIVGRPRLTLLARIVRALREELHQLQEPGSYVGEVVKPMGKKKILVKVGFERSSHGAFA